MTPGFASVAAAVHDHAGRPAAGVAVTFPAEEVDDAARATELARRVARAAAELTRRINGHPPEASGIPDNSPAPGARPPGRAGVR